MTAPEKWWPKGMFRRLNRRLPLATGVILHSAIQTHAKSAQSAQAGVMIGFLWSKTLHPAGEGLETFFSLLLRVLGALCVRSIAVSRVNLQFEIKRSVEPAGCGAHFGGGFDEALETDGRPNGSPNGCEDGIRINS